MNWPQITVIVIYAMSMAIAIVKHGEPREPYSVWVSDSALVVMIWLLWAGGFWS